MSASLVRALLTLLGLSLVSSGVFAATVVCSGTVDVLQYDSNDMFAIKLSSMNTPVYFCSPQSTWNVTPGFSTGPETCKAMYATFLAAKLSGTPLTAMYFDGDSVPATCDSWATWRSASIRHYVFQ